MSDTQTAGGTASEHVHDHPTPRDYVNIALLLGVITALEVMASYVAMPEALFIGGLTAMAIAKFGIVVGYYMHLKYDSRMFRRLFIFGVVLAVTVFLLVLGLFILSPALPPQ